MNPVGHSNKLKTIQEEVDFRSKIETLTSHVKHLQKQVETRTQTIINLEETQKTLSGKCKHLKEYNDVLLGELEANQGTVSLLNSEVETLNEAFESLAKELEDERKQAVEEAERRTKQIQELLGQERALSQAESMKKLYVLKTLVWAVAGLIFGIYRKRAVGLEVVQGLLIGIAFNKPFFEGCHDQIYSYKAQIAKTRQELGIV